MRVCIDTATGRLIEAQSNARPGTLIANAEALGYNKATLVEQEVDMATAIALAKTQDTIDAERKDNDTRTAWSQIVSSLPAWQATESAIAKAFPNADQSAVVKLLAMAVYVLMGQTVPVGQPGGQGR